MTLYEFLNSFVREDEDFVLTSLYGRVKNVSLLWHYLGDDYLLLHGKVLEHLGAENYVAYDQELIDPNADNLRLEFEKEKAEVIKQIQLKDQEP